MLHFITGDVTVSGATQDFHLDSDLHLYFYVRPGPLIHTTEKILSPRKRKETFTKFFHCSLWKLCYTKEEMSFPGLLMTSADGDNSSR